MKWAGIVVAFAGGLALLANFTLWLLRFMSGEFGWLNVNGTYAEGQAAFAQSWYYHQWPYYHIVGIGAIAAVIGLSLMLAARKVKG